MKKAISYHIDSKLIRGFPDTVHSLNKLRVAYPFLWGAELYFRLNFDKFTVDRFPKKSEADFSDAVIEMDDFEEIAKRTREVWEELLDEFQESPKKVTNEKISRLKKIKPAKLKLTEWQAIIAQVKDVLAEKEKEVPLLDTK